MPILTVLFDVLGPVVAIVAVGAIVGPRLGIDALTLSRLAYWILGPAFMFDVLADADLEMTVILQLTLASWAGMAAAALLVALVLRARSELPDTIAAGVLTASYGNVGNAGLAISAFAFGQSILPAAGVFMLTINTTGMMLGVGLSRRRDGSLWAAGLQALVAPMTVASLLALGANVTQWQPPPIIDRSVGLVAAALIPVMLFTLGMQLWETARTSLLVQASTVVATIGKLVVAPAAATAAAAAIGLSTTLVALSAVQSAMPPAVFCMVLAIEHDLEPDNVTGTVVLATMASLLTLPIVLLLVAPAS